MVREVEVNPGKLMSGRPRGSDSKVGSQEYHMQHSNENENKGKTSDEEISGE